MSEEIKQEQESEFNIVDRVSDIDTSLPENDVDLAEPKCEDCGYPMDEDWRACPRCGKVTKPFDIWEVLATIKDAPSREKVEKLKEEKGLDIRLAVMSEDRVYLIVPVMRDRWKQFNNMVKNIKDDDERQDKLMELVVNTCVIWPKIDSESFGGRAFTYATLFEQIMHISDFIPPQVAVQMVYKL